MPFYFPCYATGTDTTEVALFVTDRFPFVADTVADVAPERFNIVNAVGAWIPVAPVNPVEPDAP
jgi:hypothetical protein